MAWFASHDRQAVVWLWAYFMSTLQTHERQLHMCLQLMFLCRIASKQSVQGLFRAKCSLRLRTVTLVLDEEIECLRSQQLGPDCPRSAGEEEFKS